MIKVYQKLISFFDKAITIYNTKDVIKYYQMINCLKTTFKHFLNDSEENPKKAVKEYLGTRL